MFYRARPDYLNCSFGLPYASSDGPDQLSFQLSGCVAWEGPRLLLEVDPTPERPMRLCSGARARRGYVDRHNAPRRIPGEPLVPARLVWAALWHVESTHQAPANAILFRQLETMTDHGGPCPIPNSAGRFCKRAFSLARKRWCAGANGNHDKS